MITTKDLWEAISIAKREVKDPYAQNELKTFTKEGLYLGERNIGIQLQDILSNLHSWTGTIAERCKAVFKHFIELTL